jgi:hypothetical protein
VPSDGAPSAGTFDIDMVAPGLGAAGLEGPPTLVLATVEGPRRTQNPGKTVRSASRSTPSAWTPGVCSGSSRP